MRDGSCGLGLLVLAHFAKESCKASSPLKTHVTICHSLKALPKDRIWPFPKPTESQPVQLASYLKID